MAVFSPRFPQMLEEATTIPSQPTRLMQTPFHVRKETTVAMATNCQSHGTNDDDENRTRRGRHQPHPRLSKATASSNGDEVLHRPGTYEALEKGLPRSRRTSYRLAFKQTWSEQMIMLHPRKGVALRATNPLTRILRVRPKDSTFLKTALR